MLLWELLETPRNRRHEEADESVKAKAHTRRLPYDIHCCAVTKSGRRCRGKARKGREYCVFHDPEIAARREKARLSGAAKKRRRSLSHLPDGYLRKLTDHRSVGNAMDRLYREVRLGIITPEMGRVLFSVLTRILDSGLADLNGSPKAPSRTKAARLRPKMEELLTKAEKIAWNKAVANAPGVKPEPTKPRPKRRTAPPEQAIKPQRVSEPSPQGIPAVVHATT